MGTPVSWRRASSVVPSQPSVYLPEPSASPLTLSVLDRPPYSSCYGDAPDSLSHARASMQRARVRQSESRMLWGTAASGPSPSTDVQPSRKARSPTTDATKSSSALFRCNSPTQRGDGCSPALAPRPRLLLLEHPTRTLDRPEAAVDFGQALVHASDSRQVGWLAISDDERFARATGGRWVRVDPARGTVRSARPQWFRRLFLRGDR